MTPPVGGGNSVSRSLYFLAAALLGALSSGALLVLMGLWIQSSSLLVAVVGSALAAGIAFLLLAEFFGYSLPVLSRSWVVPRTWGLRGGTPFALLFGFSLGLGWRTRVGSNLFWILLLAALLLRHPLAVLAVFGIFGVVRAAPVVVLTYIHAGRSATLSAERQLADAATLGRLVSSRPLRAIAFGLLVALATSLLQYQLNGLV